MKKHGLLKILGITLLLVVIVSFILNGRSGAKDFVGLGDVALNGLKSVYYFFYMALFILAVGGFYGILNKTPSYKRLLDNIVKNFKPLGKKIIFIIIFAFAIITALTGMTLPLIIFVPFVASIVLLLGYDKLVALTSTIGSIMVGYVGGTFVTFANPSSNAISTYETFVGMENQLDNTFPKLLLLFAGIALLIFFVNKHITNVESKKVKYELNDNSDLLINEVKGNYKGIKVWPLALIMSLLFVVLVLGMFPWESLFKITFFNDFHTVIMGLTTGGIIMRLITLIVVFGLVTLVRYIISLIKKDKKNKFKMKFTYPIMIGVGILLVLEILNAANVWKFYNFSFIKSISKFFSGNAFLDFTVVTNLISSDLLAFGAWTSMGDSMTYMLICFTLLIFMIATAVVYKVKVNEFIEGLIEGMKKVLPIAALMMIAYTILVCAYTNGFFEGIVTSYGKFNYGVSSLLAMLGCLLNIDTYYVVAGVFTPIVNLITDQTVYPSVAILFQGIYGVFNLVGPTSLFLIFGLTYFDVPYTTWIKYIWRFILALLLLVALIALLAVLI